MILSHINKDHARALLARCMSYYGIGTGGCRLGGSSSRDNDETDECDQSRRELRFGGPRDLAKYKGISVVQLEC